MNFTLFNLSISLHFFSLIMWLGSLLILSRVLAIQAKNNSLDLSNSWIKKIIFGWLVPGMAIAILTGLYQLGSGGMGYYFKQGWFHTKLTLVILLIIASLIFIKKYLSKNLSFKSLMAIHGSSSLFALLIIGLTIFGTH